MNARRGFTLIEVLAALLLVAIVIPVVMQGFSVATNAASSAKRRSEAATLAASKLDEITATGDWKLGLLAGDFSPDHPEYTWDASLDAWDSSTLQQLTLRVKWTGSDGPHEFLVTTLVDQ